MNEKTKLAVEVGLASALGAVLGIWVALALHLPLWPCPLFGAVAGFLCYRPWEVLSLMASIMGTLYGGITPAASKVSAFAGWARSRKTLTGTVQVLLMGVCFCTGAVYYALLFPRINLFFLFCIPVISAVLGLVLALAQSITAESEDKIPEWMPITKWWMGFADRRIVNPFWCFMNGYFQTFPLQGRQLALLCMGFHLLNLLSHLYVVFAITMYIVDFMVTIILMLSSTRRLAALTGGAMGGGVGAIAWACGVRGGEALLVIGGISGLIAGPSFYHVRESLYGESPKVAYK